MNKKIMITAMSAMLGFGMFGNQVPIGTTPRYKPVSQQDWYKEIHSQEMSDALQQAGKEVVESSGAGEAARKAGAEAVKNLDIKW